MNGTIRKFMMEKPDRIYRNFRTPYKCIKKFLFYTSCEMQTHRKYVVLQNNWIFFIISFPISLSVVCAQKIE